jgi:hypothetical protein
MKQETPLHKNDKHVPIMPRHIPRESYGRSQKEPSEPDIIVRMRRQTDGVLMVDTIQDHEPAPKTSSAWPLVFTAVGCATGALAIGASMRGQLDMAAGFALLTICSLLAYLHVSDND